MIKYIIFFLVGFSSLNGYGQSSLHDLHFTKLASRWDEAIPLGNGVLGALVWQKDDQLRFSLDRADLWDLRPMKGLHRKEFSFAWIQEKVKEKDYAPVQQYFDYPYDHEPAPSKIPGGALEFDAKNFGEISSVHLYLDNATCEVKWKSGLQLTTWIHATKPVGWFRFENLTNEIIPNLVPPRYEGEVKVSGDPVGGDDLARLGYKQGPVTKEGNSISYTQEGWNGFTYTINVRWQKKGKSVEGTWSISSNYNKKPPPSAAVITLKSMQQGYSADLDSHKNWWKNFWSKSSLAVPDSVIEKQWYLEQYKFGATARKDAPPISLQAIWTADNGRLPPWKGDFHHDLNTQLSYWPSYSANHLEEAMGYLEHLDQNKTNYQRYTKQFFGVEGLAVPGVTTLDGTEMGGWIQYSLSPTVSSWLAQHYYLQWRYSMDRNFLRERAYPWLKSTAHFLEQVTVVDSAGHRQIPISASPEINDNDLSAWFTQNTNYDLALMKFTFRTANELATELGLSEEAAHWKKIANEFGDFVLSSNNELMFAPTLAYNQSHRHFSHAMAIHPLGLINWEDSEQSRTIIKRTLALLDSVGPDYWCGYSYAWLANLKARAKDGTGAAKALSIFAEAFCSINSFHLNGDQSGKGYSKYGYRPFTLEGNFAFAAGLQEMLLQSYAGFINVMPAVPESWKDISFNKLRAEGAFLVSATKTNGSVKEVNIIAEKGGTTRLKLPFSSWNIRHDKLTSVVDTADGFLTIHTRPGSVVKLTNTDKTP